MSCIEAASESMYQTSDINIYDALTLLIVSELKMLELLDVRLLAKKKDCCKLDEEMKASLSAIDCIIRGGVVKKAKKGGKKASKK